MNAEIKFYWELIKRRLPIMMVIFMLCAGVGVGLALTMPPKYRASAQLLVEGAQLPTDMIQSTVQSEASRELQSIRLRLMTRANLIDIASKFRVFVGEGTMSPDQVVQEMRDRTSFDIRGGGQNATILNISFTSGSAQVAADVVNEFVTYVLRADVERRTGESGETLDFFVQQVSELSERLSTQSAEIVAFKEANKDALPEGQDFRLARQSQLQERINLNARDRTSLTEQRNRVVEAGSRTGLPEVQMTPQQAEINRLETELRSKLAIYAPDSPTIEFLKRRIELLRADDLPGNDEGANEFQSMLDLQLAGIDSEIRSLEQDTETMREELAALENAIDRTPSVANQLEKLEREYAATQTQYDEAVRGRARAEQGVDVEVAAKGERVVLIEQAAVPRSPTSPNRKLIAGGGVFVGTALAAAFFILTELVNSAIRRPVDLTQALKIQPLATIPYLEEESVLRRRRILKILFILFVLISVPLGLWAVHTYYLPLDLLFEKVVERVGL